MRFLKRVFLTLLILTLSACGAKQYHAREAIDGKGEEWKAQDQDINYKKILGDFSLDRDYDLSMKFHKLEEQVKYNYDKRYNQQRYSKDPDVGLTILSIFALTIPCWGNPDCLGETGRWKNTGSPTKVNYTPSNNTRTEKLALLKDYNGSVTLVGKNKANKITSQKIFNHRFYKRSSLFKLKEKAKLLPVQPYTLQVNMKFETPQGKEQFTYNVGAQNVAQMSLFNDIWLPVGERKSMYMRKLKHSLLNGNHASAVSHYKSLESLGIKFPDSFYFRYGYSLYKTSNHTQAKKYLERYVKSAGRKGKHYTQARELLGR